MTVTDLLQDLGVAHLESGHQHCRAGWVQLEKCPFCDSENYHLGINTHVLSCSCYKCGGHRFSFLLFKLGATKKQAAAFVSDFEGVGLGPQRVRRGLVEPALLAPLLPVHALYLRERGFDPTQLVRTWNLRGIGLAAELAWRLYIPIEERGQVVSWTTRAISDRVPQRYISASADQEAVNHKSVVYGLDYCVHSVVIVEGPTDAWAIGPGAGALFGLGFSTAQVKKLSRIPYRYVCFDSTPGAQRQARKLCEQLACFHGTTVNIELDAKDAGSACKKELDLLRKTAKL